jgi:hypothetical protein
MVKLTSLVKINKQFSEENSNKRKNKVKQSWPDNTERRLGITTKKTSHIVVSLYIKKLVFVLIVIFVCVFS